MIEFLKMHGLGNDFIVLDARELANRIPDVISKAAATALDAISVSFGGHEVLPHFLGPLKQLLSVPVPADPAQAGPPDCEPTTTRQTATAAQQAIERRRLVNIGKYRAPIIASGNPPLGQDRPPS